MYLDIETNGLPGALSHITTIAVYDGKKVRHYVYGENLEDFKDDIQRYQVIVTYNGKCFDIPVIEQHFGIEMPQAHIDLRFLLHSLGYKGGLKGCEKMLGLDRAELAGVDGFFAVLLWNDYLERGDRRSLETLLAYNVLDAVNLERLMVVVIPGRSRIPPSIWPTIWKSPRRRQSLQTPHGNRQETQGRGPVVPLIEHQAK